MRGWKRRSGAPSPGRGARGLLPLLILAALPARGGPVAEPVVSGAGEPPAVAVLPVQNRSDAAAPLDRIQMALAAQLVWRGVPVLAPEVLEAFMRRHRMRYVGGLNEDLAGALREETGARAVLITSVDLYAERRTPKAALMARLVSTGKEPRILWMGSASASGDASPGFLGLGIVDDVEVLLGRTIQAIGSEAAARAQFPGGSGPRSTSAHHRSGRSEGPGRASRSCR